MYGSIRIDESYAVTSTLCASSALEAVSLAILSLHGITLVLKIPVSCPEWNWKSPPKVPNEGTERLQLCGDHDQKY